MTKPATAKGIAASENGDVELCRGSDKSSIYFDLHGNQIWLSRDKPPHGFGLASRLSQINADETRLCQALACMENRLSADYSVGNVRLWGDDPMAVAQVNVTVDKDTIETRFLPLLDLGPYRAGEPGAKSRLAAELRQASEEVGFLALINHGISQSLLDRALAEDRRFCALPLEEKLKIRINEHQRGYIRAKATQIKHSAYHQHTKMDLNETTVFATEHGPENVHVREGKQFYAQNQWPENLPGFREVVEEYIAAMEVLGKSLLPLWALALDLPEDYFDPYFKSSYTYYRMAHYPPKAEVEENEFALGAHADTGFMTLLPSPDVQGLEIMGRDGVWFRPEKVPDVIHVNIGQFLERWSNDRFHATPHRVTVPRSDDRYTIPVFVNPDFEPTVECMPTCVGADNPPKYPPQSYWDFFKWYMGQSYPHYDDFHKGA